MSANLPTDIQVASAQLPATYEQAKIVVNVPATDFDAAIEGDKPATVTALAEMGKKVGAVPADDFKRATHLIGTVKRFAEFCGENNPQDVAGGVLLTPRVVDKAASNREGRD
jgi:hypothetical protein